VSNTLLTPTIISNELLRRFKNQLAFAANASHEFDSNFNKIGDTYNMRVPVRFSAVKSATLSVQDVTETSKPLQLTTQAHAGFQFTSKDLTLTVDRFGDRYLNSAAVALANTFDADGLTLAYQSTFNAVGTPGTTPSALLTFKQAAAKLDKNACPFDGQRYVVLNSDAETSMVDALKGLFQSSDQIKKQYEQGRLGRIIGADWMIDQNVVTHTVGPLGGTPLVNGASQTGASLITDGWTAAAASRLKKGDVFTIASVFAVNPVSGSTLADLQQFVVTSDMSSDGSGNLTIPIYPSIVTSGPTKTVSGSPADNAAITVLGAASTATPQNLIFHKEAFTYAMAELELPKGVHFAGRSTDKETGLSIRIVSAYDITNDLFATRADICYGWAAKRPEWSCRIAG
jgi:P22 coat protein - gene protein 5